MGAGFTPQEWAFLFPSWPRMSPSLSGLPGPADSAADFRKTHAVTPKTLLDSLAPFPVTRTFARLSLSLGPHSANSDVLSAGLVVGLVPLCTAVFLLNDGQFGRAQLAAGTAAVLLNWTCAGLFFVASKAISRSWFTMGRVQTDDGLNGLWNPGLLELLLRGHHRAVSLSLSSFLETARRSLESGHPLRPDADAQHVALHQILIQVWQNRLDNGKGVLALFILAYQAFELASFAVSNAQVDAVGLLYAQARDELGLLLARSPRAAPGIREDLGYHEKVLAAQADVGRYKARFLVFPVGYWC
ncbi:hypothetical protein DFJ74DRAFT_701074 [Hyaloraphidium curvatum]|nr:hypothetical protein DFJ74DRAFT_701074 [Hyaloraphidium curvatum]